MKFHFFIKAFTKLEQILKYITITNVFVFILFLLFCKVGFISDMI